MAKKRKAREESDVDVILDDRGSTHGKFADNASIAETLREIWRASPNWENLTPGQQLALDEIALKTARILSSGSDPKLAEHWDDVIGYATLGRRDCVR